MKTISKLKYSVMNKYLSVIIFTLIYSISFAGQFGYENFYLGTKYNDILKYLKNNNSKYHYIVQSQKQINVIDLDKKHNLILLFHPEIRNLVSIMYNIKIKYADNRDSILENLVNEYSAKYNKKPEVNHKNIYKKYIWNLGNNCEFSITDYIEIQISYKDLKYEDYCDLTLVDLNK